MRSLPALVSIVGLTLLTGCHRVVAPSLGADRQVETGVPVVFGSPDAKDGDSFSWDLGDGSPPVLGRGVRHTYQRSGSYQVRALHEGKEVAKVGVTALPRSVLHAAPASAGSLLWVPKVLPQLERSVDFLESALGSQASATILDDASVLYFVLELAAQPAEARLLDPDEGVGMFTLHGFDGAIAMVGTSDGNAAREHMVKKLSQKGAAVTTEPDDVIRVRLPERRELGLFVDRGYLFIALPDEVEPDDDEFFADPEKPLRTPERPSADLSAAVKAVRGSPDDGLEGSGALVGLSDKVRPGDVSIWSAATKDGQRRNEAGMASFKVEGDAVTLDGFIRVDTGPLIGKAAGPSLFEKAPEGPAAALYLSLSPEGVATLAFGDKDSDRRKKANVEMAAMGLSLDELTGSMTGDLAALAYFDSQAFFKNLLVGSKKPEPRGSIVIEAGLKDPKAFDRFLQGKTELSPEKVIRKELSGGRIRYESQAVGQKVSLELSKDRMRIQAGEPLTARKDAALAKTLQGRFGEGTFSPGHLSAVADLGQVRKELEAKVEVPGASRDDVERQQSFVVTIANGITPVEGAFLDIRADDGGARVTGRLWLQGK